VDKIDYSATFGVVAADNAGLDFDVVFLSASAAQNESRNDVQSIKFTIAPPEAKKNKHPHPGEKSPPKDVGPALHF
jgi:hypothetical protein